MAWSLTAPTLAAGSTWTQVGTTYLDQNNLKLTSVVSFARLEGIGFAVRVAETRNVHTTSLTDFFQYYHRCDIGGKTGTASTGDWLDVGNNNTTQYFYFTGEAAPGTSIKITLGVTPDRAELMKTVTFTAPALLGPQLQLNVGGTARRVTKILFNAAGVSKEIVLKYNP